jgi:hypothetical protein
MLQERLEMDEEFAHGRDDGVDDRAAAAFAKIRHTLDDWVHGRTSVGPILACSPRGVNDFADACPRPPSVLESACAAQLGYEALALTDHDGVYGSLEFAHAAKALGVRPITGAEVTVDVTEYRNSLVNSQATRGPSNTVRVTAAALPRGSCPRTETQEAQSPDSLLWRAGCYFRSYVS